MKMKMKMKMTITVFILTTIYKLFLLICKHLILDQIQSYLTKLFTRYLKEYPCLYKVINYLFTILDVFNVYLYTTVFKLHDKFKYNFPILNSITVYIYIEFLGIVKGDLSRNIGVIISLCVLFDLNEINILLYTVLLLNVLFKQYLLKQVGIKINYPILYKVVLDISSLVNTCLIFYFLDSIWVKLVGPFIEKLHYTLKMTGNQNNDNNESGSDKTPGESPKEPKDPSDSEYYINKNGKKRKKPKITEEQRKKRNELQNERYRKKVEAEGRKVAKRESLAGLTKEEKEKHFYTKRRKNADNKKEEDIKNYPILKDILRRRKNKGMTEEEIKEFDKISRENRKKSKAEYWEANKERPELKRPGRSGIIYRDRHNLYEDPNYLKPIEDKKFIRFVDSDLKGKEKKVLPEQILAEQGLDKGKGKAKLDEVISLSGSEDSGESSEHSAFEDDINEAIRQSRNNYDKKGESSKKGGSK